MIVDCDVFEYFLKYEMRELNLVKKWFKVPLARGTLNHGVGNLEPDN